MKYALAFRFGDKPELVCWAVQVRDVLSVAPGFGRCLFESFSDAVVIGRSLAAEYGAAVRPVPLRWAVVRVREK